MAIIRRRYYFWLFRAYFKRMRRTIISSAILGILIFFAFVGLLNYYFRPLLFKTTQNIGYAGAYTPQTIPDEILNNVSYGLTKVEPDGEIEPAAASSWTIAKDKIYTFKLKKGQYFHNGDELTSSNIGFSFQDVTTKIIDKYTVQYTLKDPYAPFLTVVAHPIFGKNFTGLGRYKIGDIELNGGFVKSITLIDTQSNGKKKIFFYPTQMALKIAFMLGEVSEIKNVTSTKLDDGTDFSTWPKVKIDSFIDYSNLVLIFYNNNDSVLSNKKVRQALNYALPQSVTNGIRAYGPIPPTSIYYEQPKTYKISDADLSKTLLSTVKDSFSKPLEISTTQEFENEAKEIQKDWKKIGINTTIKIVLGVPSDFQIFLYQIKLPQDPDQYVLWHSNQQNNIVHYQNLRIDKLLEDGRSTTDIEKRKENYADFQKYLTDDVPASFLYFPREYNIEKNDR